MELENGKQQDNQKNVESALLKRALGYDTQEIVEEFQQSDGDIVLTKRKVTTKNIPPDISAVKTLLELHKDESLNVKTMTDKQLEEQKIKYLNLLKELEDGKANKK